MSAQTVLLIWSNPLFLDSIQRLLKNPAVTCVDLPLDTLSIKDEIHQFRPDVVIIEKTANEIPLNVMEIFGTYSRKMRVLEVSLSHNEISIYQHQQMMIGKADDLLNFILD